jgi:hypothetical protein
MGVLMLARALPLAGIILVFSFASVGCFNAPKPNCAFLCGESDSCPEDYMCSPADGRCHLVVEGVPATCEDALPSDAGADAIPADADLTPDADLPDASTLPDARLPDAGPPDANVPDANVPDASPPPDAFVNHAPVMGAVTTPINVVAGATAVSVQINATDVDVGQTLSFSAPPAGTNRSPYEFRAGAASDTVGGAFNVGNRTFTLPPGILGTFDVNFTVDDGSGAANDTDTAFLRVIVAASPVHINEIQAGSDAAHRNLEIINAGGSAVDLDGWQLVINGSSFTIPNNTTVAAGGFLVLHADTGTDDATNLFSVGLLNSLSSSDEIALYQSPTDLELSRFMRDFVKWGAGSGRVDQATFAKLWPSTMPADFFDPTGIDFDATGSIALTPGASAQSAAAYYAEDVATLGAPNDP